IQMGIVGLGIQHQTGGFGFYIDEDRVAQELERGAGNAKYREDLHDVLTYWKARNTNVKVLGNMPEDIRKALVSDQWRTMPLPASPILRMAGAYVDFDKLVCIGIPGLRDEVRYYREGAAAEGGDVVLFDSMLDVLELVAEVCIFYSEQARTLASQTDSETRREQLVRIADALDAVPVRKPGSMLEALQLVWIYGIMGPLIEYGRLDEYLGDLYVHDVERGIITEEDAVELLRSFFRLIDHLDCETDGRVIVGGYGRRNPENADRLSLHAIEACRTVKEVLPQFTLRFNKETPSEVWDASMRCIEEGRTYPLLYNDDVLVPGVMNAFDVGREMAETYMPLGCGEIEFDHHSIGTPSGSMNTLKILELAMRGNYEPMTGWHLGPETTPITDCRTIDEFMDHYKAHLNFYIEAQAKFEKYEYEITGKMHPFMMVTMLYDGCLERGRAIFNGGCAYLAGTLEMYGNVNAANSLAAMKKLVFEEKVLSAQQLMDAMDANFVGHERLRKLLMDAPKYGNDDDYVDSIFTGLHDYLNETTKRQAEKVGLDSYLSVTINNAQNTTLGRLVGATPDGRKAGTRMANANNPSPGTDKNGLTAMLNSILKPRHDNHAGMVSNIRFTRETFSGHPEKTQGLLADYFDRGAAHAMITVVGQDDLKNAMVHPEEYSDLIVRVGGFSARFVELKKDVQQEIYDRVTY
ncbi:MAG: pyruvate formate lyase family protein, partial [Spirochaetaceae bacterium]|nr:pyruvate formate lyase family protein [Spirochaetaceae bacterium]